MKHIYTINEKPKKIPTVTMADGAITGNGDVSVTWGGSSDRIHLYISKSDFWKGTGHRKPGEGHSVYGGGYSPLGIVEILMPHLAYAPYHVEQRIDEAVLEGNFVDGEMDAKITVTVCATENTILLELDRTCPGLSVSAELTTIEGNEAICEKVSMGNIQYITRSFEEEELHFETKGIAVMKEVSCVRQNGREKKRWSIHICTNHDLATYHPQAIAAAEVMDDARYNALSLAHSDWWKRFWSVSSLRLEDTELESQWYMGMYIMACCARNKKFPPGLWGNFITSDNMMWEGDYHLNYNHEAPFVALFTANHVELTDCYHTPILQFLPLAKKFAKEYLGCSGVYYPVALGPMGMEGCINLTIKEHGKTFLGQKSHAVYATVPMVMRWYSTYDEDYAREYALPFMLEVADFWEDYLVKEDGKYWSFNDALFEVAWWSDPDYMPVRHDETNPISSVGLVNMLMNCLVDICETMNIHKDRIAKWKDIAMNFGPAKVSEPTRDMFVSHGYLDEKEVYSITHGDFHITHEPVPQDGGKVYLGSLQSNEIDPYMVEYIYPANQVSTYSTPEMHKVARHTFELLNCWNDERMPYNVCPAAVRLGIEPEIILEHLRNILKVRQLPNGTLAFLGGGIENNSIVPNTLQEMMLQSYEKVIRLFPCWNKDEPAAFTGWRAYGAFIIDATLKEGEIEAIIRSEKGKDLSIAKPGNGYVLVYGAECIPLTEATTTVKTKPGDIFYVRKA